MVSDRLLCIRRHPKTMPNWSTFVFMADGPGVQATRYLEWLLTQA
jgi:hypothetical protein